MSYAFAAMVTYAHFRRRGYKAFNAYLIAGGCCAVLGIGDALIWASFQ